MLPTLYKKSSLCWHYFRLSFIVILCFSIQFVSLLVPFWCSLPSFWVPFGALGLSFGILGPSFGALGPQVRKITPRERIGREFGVQIGLHLEPNFHSFSKKNGFGSFFSRFIFLSRFLWFFGRPGVPRNYENQAKHLYCCTKIRFSKNQKLLSRSRFLASFWLSFWCLWP